MATIENNSEQLAVHTINHTEDLYRHSTTLYRHQSGKLYLRETGGNAMHVDRVPQWVSEDEAVEWVYGTVTDPITGYNYTMEQAKAIVSGQDPGNGYRDMGSDE